MSYAEAIISGILQGLTEFLPISSSGHLALFHNYFGYRASNLFFDIFLHVGTLFAILVYFWHDIIKVITRERRLLWLVVIGSIPTAAIGFLFKDIFAALFTNVKAVGVMLFITAGFLLLGEGASKRYKLKGGCYEPLGWRKALIIGLVQGAAIIPGISRSGSTIATGLLLRMNKKEAVGFSFLLAIPAIIGALLFELVETGSAATVTPPMLAGAISAYMVSLAAIHILIKWVYAERLKFFAAYCFLAGAMVLLGAL